MESKVLEKIISDIIVFKEDNPHIVITENDIKSIIEGNTEELIKEIKEELNKY